MDRTGISNKQQATSNKHKGDVMERREQQLPTLDQMRAASEALKGVERACDITHAKPEFVEFIRKCSPASVIALLNQHTALVEQRDLLVAALRGYVTNRCQCYQGIQCHDCETKALLATVEQGHEELAGGGSEGEG